jgi:lipid II:glycine glycyltransferase (peptidoglycan interpeptide bridge formation enzyme)
VSPTARPDPRISAEAAAIDGYEPGDDRARRTTEWDEFVAHASGDVLPQTDRWAATKAPGFAATTVVARDNGAICAGAQLLVRRLPRIGALGSVGYVPHGPLVGDADGDTVNRLVDALLAESKRQRVRALIVQPAAPNRALDQALEARGFRPAPTEVAPSATIEVDLTPDPDVLMQNMRTDHRRSVRRAERAGVVIRHGSDADVPTFHELYRSTSVRQGFEPMPLEHLRRQWEILHPVGSMEMLVSEYEGTVLSAGLLTCFGDRVIYRLTGWSGASVPSAIRPNHLLQWRAMQWSRQAGFRYYDLGGIDRAAALALQGGSEPPPGIHSGPAEFKLGFGGRVAVYPTAVWQFSPAVLRPARRAMDGLLREGSAGHRVLARLRAG